VKALGITTPDGQPNTRVINFSGPESEIDVQMSEGEARRLMIDLMHEFEVER